MDKIEKKGRLLSQTPPCWVSGFIQFTVYGLQFTVDKFFTRSPLRGLGGLFTCQGKSLQHGHSGESLSVLHYCHSVAYQ